MCKKHIFFNIEKVGLFFKFLLLISVNTGGRLMWTNGFGPNALTLSGIHRNKLKTVCISCYFVLLQKNNFIVDYRKRTF